MIRAAALLLALAAPAWGESAVPSGIAATPHDVLVETQPDGEVWLVLRYLAPAIAGGAVSYDEAQGELDRLCATDGLSEAESLNAEVAQIIVVLMDRAVIRGVSDPEATQFIGAYSPVGGECLWQ